MNHNLFLVCILIMIFPVYVAGQENTGRFEFSQTNARPEAKLLMKEAFYWSPIDESAPFGSDAGSDAAQGFYKWSKDHPSISVMVYLKGLITSWNFPAIAWDETDTLKLKEYINRSAPLDERIIEEQVKRLNQINDRSSTANGQKALSDEQLRQIVINSAKKMGASYLIELDEAIIGTAFAQFVLQGKIDSSLRHFAEISLKREMLPLLTAQYRQDARKAHNQK